MIPLWSPAIGVVLRFCLRRVVIHRRVVFHSLMPEADVSCHSRDCGQDSKVAVIAGGQAAVDCGQDSKFAAIARSHQNTGARLMIAISSNASRGGMRRRGRGGVNELSGGLQYAVYCVMVLCAGRSVCNERREQRERVSGYRCSACGQYMEIYCLRRVPVQPPL